MKRWKLTPKRKAKARRDSKGRFVEWEGGRHISTYSKKWQNNNEHGNRTHIGQVWAKQHSRRPRVGDIVRTKTKSGRYHKGAPWYVRTRYGWRDTGSANRPNPATIKRICARARPTRRK